MSTSIRIARLLLTAVCLYLPALSMAGKPATGAAESISVKINWSVVGDSGTASAEGCSQCPMRFTVDGKTRFFIKRRKISSDSTEIYSGQPGTVIYDVSDHHALKVVW